MRKQILVLIIACLLSFSLAGCGNNSGMKNKSELSPSAESEAIVQEEQTDLDTVIDDIIEESEDNKTYTWEEAISELEEGNLAAGIEILKGMEPEEIELHEEYTEYLSLAEKYVDSKWNGEWQNPGFSPNRITKIFFKDGQPYLGYWVGNTGSFFSVEFPEDTTDTIYAMIPKGRAGFEKDGNLVLKTDDIMVYPYYTGETYEFGRVGSGETGTYERKYKDISVAEKKPEPSIGMTAIQVLESSWGEPSEKNITKTVNGTSEQWVYSIGNYIYLENGIVTAIQEKQK